MRLNLLSCYYQTLGSYFYVLLILLCYARRHGLGLSVFHDIYEIVYLMVQLKVATLIHIWVDWLRAPGESSVVLGYPGVPM